MYKENCKLLYTDTDSLIYAVKCDDFYADMKKISPSLILHTIPVQTSLICLMQIK